MSDVVYQCEQCGAEVNEADAHTDSYPGVEGAVVLAFCPGCVSNEYL